MEGEGETSEQVARQLQSCYLKMLEQVTGNHFVMHCFALRDVDT